MTLQLIITQILRRFVHVNNINQEQTCIKLAAIYAFNNVILVVSGEMSE